MAEGLLAKPEVVEHLAVTRPAGGQPVQPRQGRGRPPRRHITPCLLKVGVQSPGVECPESAASRQQSDTRSATIADALDPPHARKAEATPAPFSVRRGRGLSLFRRDRPTGSSNLARGRSICSSLNRRRR